MARKPRTFTGPNRSGELQLQFHDVLGRREIVVSKVIDLTPRARRIVFTGDDLADGFPFARFAPLDHVRVFFPNPDTGELVSYRQDAAGEWALDGAGDPVNRDYTVRGWDEQTRELTLEFVLHERGVAAGWARSARPGDVLVANGPSAHWHLPENYPSYLVAGDETALPAIARIVEEAPVGSRVTAVVEVADAHEEQPLAGVADVELQWVHRDSSPVDEGHLSPLETALRRRDYPDVDSLFVVIAGEANALRPIRRFFRQDVGVPRRQLVVDGYWKRGVASFDHHDENFDGE